MSTEPRVPWQVKYVALALIWGSSFLLMKLALGALAPVQVSSLRIVSGAAVLVALLGLTRGRLPRDRRVWGHLAVSSLFLTVLPFTGFVVGETRVSSALAGIGNATTPLAAVVFGWLLLPVQRLARRQVVAVVAGFLGVVVINQPWAAGGRPDPVGFALVVAAGACYGLGWTYNRRYLSDADLGGLSQPTALLLCGSVAIVPVLIGWWVAQRDRVPAPWAPAPDAAVGVTAYPLPVAVTATLVLGVVGTGIAYMLQYDVVRGAGAVASTTVTYLIPVVSVALGVLVLGEELTAPQLVGFAVVLGSAVAVAAPGSGRPIGGRALSRQASQASLP